VSETPWRRLPAAEARRGDTDAVPDAPFDDLRSLLPLLESPRQDAGLDEDTACRLVAYGATAWSDWWASKALDWVDQGVWGVSVAEALRSCSQNALYSQATRHRAWHYVKPGAEPPTP
jgi:hypothetical protein